MIRELKAILLAVARLPLSDQRWILKKLPADQRATFEQLNGLRHLEEALRFKALQLDDHKRAGRHCEAQTDTSCVNTNDHWAILALKDPLYIAIILKQGNYEWTTDFLQQYDQEGAIEALMADQVNCLKPLSKQALFIAWEKHGSFEDYLEKSNG